MKTLVIGIVFFALLGLAIPVIVGAGRFGEPKARLVIPDDKKDEAAAFTAKLVESMKEKYYNPESIYKSASEQALKIYGVPVHDYAR